MTDLFDNLDDLSPEQRELLALLLAEEGVALPEERIPAAPRLPSADGSSRAPLSFAQQRLWFLDLLEPGSPVYNIPAAVELTGELNVPALRAALQAVVDRHEPLRTRFVRDGDEPAQEILPHVELPLPMADLSAMGPEGAEAEARRLAAEDAAAPFDLAAAPLLRARLLRLSEAKHALLFNMHHIVSDGWSVGVLIREVAALYAAFLAHPGWSTEDAAQAASLPPLDTQYADYAVWQRGYLQGDTLRGQLDYWRARLSGAPALLELPTDRPRPPVQSGRGSAEYFRLSREVSAGLDRLAHAEGATIFMVLLAAFQTLLFRHAGQDDILVGTPVANRTRAELEPLIGFFVNTLVIRADFSANPTFRELLRQARDRVVEAQANQDAQFEMLVEELKPERNMSYTPLFQAMFAFQKAGADRVQLPGLTLAPVDAHSGAAKFDLLLNLTDAPDGFAGSLEYNTDIFEPETIRRMITRFEVLARGIVEGPDQRVSSLPALTDADRRRVLVEWNDTAVNYGPRGALHELIEQQVDRTPDALAVMAEAAPVEAARLDLSAQLTYRELDGRANQLAHFLRSRGIGPDALVAVCAERSLEMMVALLGILKAGAAYVPIDPGYPADRIRYMLTDCGARVLLTQAHLLQNAEWEAGPGVTVVCLDTECPEIARHPADRLRIPLQPAGLAYMIYTSGSTGKPKGAMVHHAGIVNRLLWMQEEYGLVPAERVMQKTPFSFDVSVWEFFWPLLTGATVVFARPEGHKDARYLMRLIDAAGITTMHFVPSMLAAFLAAAPEVGGASLTRVICSGEALPYDLQERFFARFPHTALRNLYGPTEAAVDVTHWPCVPGDPRKIVPIGYPVANTQMYILNRDLQPVPPGAVGELYIAGVQVGRGYLNRPELTAERFLPDPFIEDDRLKIENGRSEGNLQSSIFNLQSPRMYRTGDLARHLPDGAIEYLGRVDFQVKLRGFRIELGEIESTLRQHPALADAVVVARKVDGSGDSQLVAYIAPKTGEQTPVIAELRRYLLGRLPDYMVPAAFVSLAALPLSPNGKVDRKALPAPVVDRAALGESYVAPATPTEEVLASIWSRLLRAPKVGGRDNFFDLGGHSLLATQLVSRIRESFGVDLPLRSLFERPTVSGLAELIDRQRLGGDAPLPAIEPAPRAPDADGAARLPLSFAQQRLWFLEQLDPGGTIYNIPSAVRLTGRLDAGALEGALNDIVARHESLRTTFGDADGKAFQVIWPAMPLTVNRVDLSAEPDDRRKAAALELARQETLRPFDLTAGPLIRATLLRLGEDEHVLLLTMHHIISDGWSVAVLIREFAQLYEARVAEKPAALPPAAPAPLTLQYADYAAWQRTWLEGERAEERQGERSSPLQRQLHYWREQLADLPALLELPSDHARPPALTYRGGLRTFRLPADLSERLREFGRAEGATLYMTLLAAMETLLARLSGQDDFAIGSPVAGRNRAETESIIGFFINTLVLRSDLRARGETGGPASFRELLARVRATSLDAYAHQDVPFEMLVGSLDARRSASHTPLFQVMLTLQNIPGEPLALPGLTLAAFDPPTETAKFDLNWTFIDDPAGLQGALEYSSALFDAETADRFAACFVTLLAAAVERPDQVLTTLPVVPEADRALIFGAWNDTRVAVDADATIGQRFEAQARRAPDATAVVAEQEVDGRTITRSLTYGELNRRANQLARRLRSLGVGPESIVGLTIERGTDLLVGVMGILKAGAAYLPLDPSYPADRLAYMLADSGARAIVTYERFLSDEHGEMAAVCLDRDWPEIAALPDDDLAPPAGPNNLAYVIYTSGSTGRPKGVTIPHRAALNLAAALHHAAYRHAKEDRPLRLSLNAPLAFDASVQQLVMLTQGHALYVVPQDARGDGAAFLAFIRRHRLDQFDCVPSQLKLILDAGLLDENAEWTPSIVFPGGEAIDDATWAKLAAAPATDFYNMYGPTECACDSTTVSAREAPARATIGRPMANVRAYVLDRNLQPVPAGVPGELFLAGDGVGRGYLHRPDLTAERFLPDPFNSTQMTQIGKDTHGFSLLQSGPSAPSASSAFYSGGMYRTGDLVRWTRDGLLEFLGRVDFQVKVRGFRIELGEIEDALRKHAAVGEAVVVAREIPGSGGKQLVAYLTPAGAAAAGDAAASAAAPSVGELRQHLLASLPDYMVPAIFVTLDALPLTPNRKVDRKALPAPEAAGVADTGKEYVAPETPAEQALAAVWAQVLGVPRVGRNDDFFELGGDSILSIQVVSRANQAGLRITPKQLFQAPTLAALAALAGTEAAAAVAQGPVTGPVALTPIQRRFFELELADRNHWNQSILLTVAEPLDAASLSAAVAALVAHHDALRLRFTESATGPQARNAGVDEAGSAPFEHVDLSALDDSAAGAAAFSAEVERRAAETQARLNITDGPLFRAAYYDAGAARPGRLFLVIHHLAVDGVSWRILLEDLQTAYGQHRQGAAIRLPAKTVSFQAWSEKLAAWAGSEAVLAELDGWLARAGGWVSPLPVDNACAPEDNTESSAAQVAVTLSAEDTASLLTTANAAYNTEVPDLLLAALAQTVEKWTGEGTLSVHLEGHGREEIGEEVDVSRTVGWFTTLYPVRIDLPWGAGPGEAIVAAKEQLRAIPQRGLGYGLLRYLGPDDARETLASAPEPEMTFNYLGQLDQVLSHGNGPATLGPAPEMPGRDRAEGNRRDHLLDISAAVAGGRLSVSWTYSRAAHAESTARQLAEWHIEALQALISHCRSPEAGAYTPSDFPLAELDQKQLDKVLKKVKTRP